MVNFASTLLLALATSAAALPHERRHQHRHVARATSGSKRGIAYDQTKFADAFTSGAVSWAWNWQARPGDYGSAGALPQGIEFVPMLYNQASVADFPANVAAAIQSGTTHVLGFNEIDQCGGGGTCMGIADAAKYYNQAMRPLVGKVKIGSPSVTSDQSPGSGKGVPALVNWAQACGADCPVDFIQLHWYGAGGDPEVEANSLISFIQDFAAPKLRAHFGRDLPIWLTEFAPKVDVVSIQPAEHTAFIQHAIPKLDACPLVERYSYFMAKPNFLNNGDGSLAGAGKAYIS